MNCRRDIGLWSQLCLYAYTNTRLTSDACAHFAVRAAKRVSEGAGISSVLQNAIYKNSNTMSFLLHNICIVCETSMP